MALNLTNSRDLIVNSLSLIKGNNIENVLDVFLSKDEAISGIVGLPPSTLDTLEKIGQSIDNDPNFCINNQTRINEKADTTYVNGEFEIINNTLIDKVDTSAFINNINFNSELFQNIYTKTQSDLISDSKASLEFVNTNLNSTINYVDTNLNNKVDTSIFVENINNNTNLFNNIYTTFETVENNNIKLSDKVNTSIIVENINNNTNLFNNLSTAIETNNVKLNDKVETSVFVENINNNTNLFSNIYTTFETIENNNVKLNNKVENSVLNNALLSISENLNNYQTIDSNTILLNNRYTKAESNNLLNLKNDLLISGDVPNGFSILTNKVVRGLSVESPLTLSNQGEFLKIGIDSDSINNDNVYSKSDVNSLLNNKQNNIIFSNPSNGFALSNNSFVMKGISVEGALSLVDSQSELKIILNEDLINQSKFNNIDSTILNIQNNINTKQNSLISGSFGGASSIIVGNTIKSIIATTPVILTSSANHLSLSLTNDFINKSYAKSEVYTKSETYTRAIIDSGFASLYQTGAEARRFTNPSNQDVLVLNSDKSIELKGNTINNGTLSVLNNALFSNNLDVLATANIERAIIRNVSVETGGVNFKNNANNDIMKVFSTGLLIQSSLIIGGGATVSGLPSPFFCAGKVDGNNLTKMSSKGKYGFTVTRQSFSTGVFKISFDTPASSADYIVMTTQIAKGLCKVWENPDYAPSVNEFFIVMYNDAGNLSNAVFYFTVYD